MLPSADSVLVEEQRSSVPRERGWNGPVEPAEIPLLVLTGAAKPSDLIPAPTLPTYLGSSVAAVERDIPRVDVRAAAEQPDLILMDIELPLLDGYEATRRIKTDPAMRNIPIIIVTSYALIDEENKARAAGCDDFVRKPFELDDLEAVIRSYISNGA